MGPWPTQACPACCATFASEDDFETRLVWALGHPDTATAARAAAALAARHAVGALDPLRVMLRHAEIYRAAAAAGALVAFMDEPAARQGVAEARAHPSVIVRVAVERALASHERRPARNGLRVG